MSRASPTPNSASTTTAALVMPAPIAASSVAFAIVTTTPPERSCTASCVAASPGSPRIGREVARDLEPRRAQHARDHEPVAAVVARPAHHRDAPARREPAHDLGDAAARGLHQHDAGQADLGRRGAIERAHLRDSDDRSHRAPA